jgi:hypothetical protein
VIEYKSSADRKASIVPSEEIIIPEVIVIEPEIVVIDEIIITTPPVEPLSSVEISQVAVPLIEVIPCEEPKEIDG